MNTFKLSNGRDPSAQQTVIFDFIRNGDGNAIVQAAAGSGKTTTCVESCRLIHPKYAIQFMAFNKNIVDELKARLPRYADCRTFHSMCKRAVDKYFGTEVPKVNLDKTRDLLKAVVEDKQDFYTYQTFVRKLVSVAKAQAEPVPLTELVAYYDLDVDEGDLDTALGYAQEVLTRSDAATDTIDFDDMLRFCHIYPVTFPEHYDYIFVDEAQDLSPLQHAILAKAAPGRLIAVGDRYQAIYAFRGADSNSMSNLATLFNCTELPLSVSYRCPSDIVRLACSETGAPIDPAPGATPGSIQYPASWDQRHLTPSDVVLCRNSAPLIKLAFSLLANHTRCHVLGRDIGQGLLSLIKKLKPKDLPHLHQRLSDHLERQSAKEADGSISGAKLGALVDRVDCIKIFMSNSNSLDDLTGNIKSMFEGDDRGVTLSTIHKAKGTEFQRVHFLDSWLIPSKYATQAWQQSQETNLKYVAITRSQNTLTFLQSRDYLSA